MKARNLYPSEKELLEKMLTIFYQTGFVNIENEILLPLSNVDGTERAIFSMQKVSLPTIIEKNNEEVPLNQTTKGNAYPENQKEDTPKYWDFDNLLGAYFPQEVTKGKQSLRIELYTDKIEECAHKLTINAQHLKDIVLLHELGHWITHKLPYKDGSVWSNYHIDTNDIELTNVHEGWAQLLTWWIVKDIGQLNDAFTKLNKKQSPPYQVWEKFKDENTDDVCKSLLKMREEKSVTIDNWHKAIIEVIKNDPDRIGEATGKNIGVL